MKYVDEYRDVDQSSVRNSTIFPKSDRSRVNRIALVVSEIATIFRSIFPKRGYFFVNVDAPERLHG
jgi:hypothetical protein